MAYIKEDELLESDGYEDIKVLETVEDVATLLETFEEVVQTVNYKRIKKVLSKDGYFFFVIGDTLDGIFDMYSFINKYFDDELNITPLNARLVFPKRFSRGIYTLVEYNEEYNKEYNRENMTGSDTLGGTDYDDDDIPTAYLDEDFDLEKLGTHTLRYKKLNTELIVKEGERKIIGRSSGKVDFQIKNNLNVGRTHCSVYVEEGRLMVHDFSSTNGTFVNNTRIHSGEDHQLLLGDILVVADEEFEVVG